MKLLAADRIACVVLALLAPTTHAADAANPAVPPPPAPDVAAAPAPAPAALPPETLPPAAVQSYVHPWQRQVAQLAPDAPARGPRLPVLSAQTAPTQFALAFAEAKVPDCLHSEGLKRQPPRIGPFVFMGVIALPFVALAKIRGKCI